MRNVQPILLIEDDHIDAVIVKRAMRDLNIPNQLIHTANGEEALEYLRTQSNKTPSIILLDLNMPKMDGFEFLKIIKADELLRNIPVIVLTTSCDEEDVFECFALGAAGYMLKSSSYEKFVESIKAINNYWTLSELPNIDIIVGSNHFR